MIAQKAQMQLYGAFLTNHVSIMVTNLDPLRLQHPRKMLSSEGSLGV